MSKIQLILLGHFECLLSSGTRISLSMRKAEVLLAYLALAPGIRHPRERLINLLWSDRGEEQARNSLRQCLSAIKKSLGDAADLILQVDRTTVALKPELVDVDALEFERLAMQGNFESLSTAVDLYRGEFLEGISIRDAASQEWLDNERGRFRRQFIEILLNLAETQLVSHDFGHAIKSAERLVKQDPLGETGWRLLMRSYFESGDRSHALQAFKRCQQALRDELEVEPEAATIELRDQIAAGETRHAPTPSNRGEEKSPVAATPTKHDVKESPADSQASTDHSIAVLPFENMSGDPEQEHFADGITTDIISTLTKFKHMRVVARHSTLPYKKQPASIAEIAEQQGVRYILEGSVRKSGDRIRVNAELIDSDNEEICWNERYDRNVDDLFAVQDELTKNIALAMKVHLDDGEMALHRSIGTTNVKAWQLTLQAIDLQDTYIQKNILEARSMAKQAIELDPGYPYAWVSLGWTYWQEVYSGGTESFEAALAEAEKANHQALSLAPEYSEAWSLAGTIHMMKHETDEMLAACRKAVQLQPGNAEIQALTAFAFIFIGDLEQARTRNQNMLRLCPVLPNWYYLIQGQIEQFSGNLDAAIDIYRRGTDVEPESPLCRFYLVHALMERGDEAMAKELAAEIRALDSSVTGKGLVQSLSINKALRDRFQANLEKFGLY